MSSRTAIASVVLLVTAACSAGVDTIPDSATDDSVPVEAPEREGTANEVPRFIGSDGVRARTAPDWTVNATATVAPDDRGEFAFAQVVVATDAFELRAVEFETQGLVGTEGRADVEASVDVRLLPFGPLPQTFVIDGLRSVGAATSSVAIEGFDRGPGDFPLLTLDAPIEVPAGRLLVVVRLRVLSTVDAIALSGRLGTIGGLDDCEDHNPQGAFLTVQSDATSDGATVLSVPDAALVNGGCNGTGAPTAFNLTFRLLGRAFSDDAATALAAAAADPPAPAAPPDGPAPAATPDGDGPGAGAPADGAGSPPPAGIRIGASCSSDGATATSANGIAIACRTIWGERAWRPVPDAVARDAYTKLLAWIDALPPNDQSVPIERHPAVPIELEQVLRRALDAAGPLHRDTDQRWILLLGPRYGQPMEDVITRVFANSPPSAYPELEKWAADLRRPQSCDVYSQVGRNLENRLGFVVALIHTTPVPYCLEDSYERIATQLVREYTADAFRGNGWPCWAGEAAGWPTARALMDRLGLISWEDDWSYWTAQVLAGEPPDRLGLARSIDWTYEPTAGQYCFTGVGHIQGTLAHELLIHRHGVDGWEGWKRTGSFEAAYGQSMTAFMADADARLTGTLGGSIAP